MEKKKSRALKANGARIRSLREETGKTQKELLHGSTVGMRTYQRAEQGLPISPAVLREIAALLKVSLGTIVRDPAGPRGEALRLYPCDGRGALRILKELQLMTTKLRFDFNVDPYGDAATQIADVIRFCEMNEYSQGRLETAEFIEAVGELNGKLAELYAVGVNVHFAAYTVWDVDGVEANDQIIRLPDCSRRVHLVFSEQSGITQRMMSSWETYDHVCERCHTSNCANSIHPDQLRLAIEERDGPFADHDLVAAYTDYYVRAHSEAETDGGDTELRLIENLQN